MFNYFNYYYVLMFVNLYSIPFIYSLPLSSSKVVFAHKGTDNHRFIKIAVTRVSFLSWPHFVGRQRELPQKHYLPFRAPGSWFSLDEHLKPDIAGIQQALSVWFDHNSIKQTKIACVEKRLEESVAELPSIVRCG